MNRLDKELVKRNLVETRTKAQELIDAGSVFVNGKIQKKSSFNVVDTDDIKISNTEILKYVSRGGFKLEKALDVFKIDVKDQVVMDIGSSTGGFTDCCLQNGAKKVVAVDVGSNIMHKSLREHTKVELYENMNIKNLPHNKFSDVDLIVVDVSFVSLEHIVEKVNSENIKVDMICLIKPQFECGKQIATKYGGVIKSKTVHKSVLNNVIKFFNKNNFFLLGLDFSPIKGGDGNIEYISHFSNKTDKNFSVEFEKVVNIAFNGHK
ncbi:MAG: TlyA family RNA methyltransferase [Clostridia bacterium]|nr:TlyA family RNA methyltransferase [Clostridia bacterium]